MTAVAAETLAGKGLEATGELPEALKRELGSSDPQKGEAVSVAVATPARGSPGHVVELGEVAGKAHAGGAVEGTAQAQAREPATPEPVPAGEAAEQLAAAVTAALRPDAAPLDYGPCRQGVGTAVRHLRGALLGLMRALEPHSGTTPEDSAVARAQHLAADIRFVRPHETG
ncbi:MAG TPA: hypothetical protein VHC18_04500 [Amycolatopsis sp.]|nr:hypothetical protein [Amycolatopsis sp.]